MFERKGVQFFIKAVADLKSKWEILIAGDGPYLNKLKELARNIPTIKFLGFVSGPALAQLYKSSKIFVFPSVQENFPVVLLEAMEAGCAIVTTDAPGCVEVVGNEAIITRCGQVSEIRNAIEYLMTNENEVNRLSCRARDRAGQFAWSAIASNFDQLSHRCLCQPCFN
jgi:glycosyltransferase involved in cell wall biosynthesis